MCISWNTCYEFSILKDNFIIFFWKKNAFNTPLQQFLIFFIIINSTVVHIVLSERNCKRKITIKNPPTNNCNTMVHPNKKVFKPNHCWIYQAMDNLVEIKYTDWLSVPNDTKYFIVNKNFLP